MITPSRMREIEINSEWRGVSREILMENAGKTTAKTILEKTNLEKICIFVGKGNNGGDGLVTARHLLNHNKKIKLLFFENPKRLPDGPARSNWKVLEQMKEKIDIQLIRDSKNLNNIRINSDILIDSLLGIGIKGEPREPIASGIKTFNKKNANLKVALDIPTGINPKNGKSSKNTTKCDLTITFHEIKKGLKRAKKEYTGEIKKVDIGIPKTAEYKTGPGQVHTTFPKRNPTSHKGENGRLLVIGGSSQYTGAPALAALSALKTGCDLVTVLSPKKVSKSISTFSPDLISKELKGKNINPENLPKIKENIQKNTGIILGPGLGEVDETKKTTIKLLEFIKNKTPELPLLLDADAIKIISKNKKILSHLKTLITPHSKEFEALTGKKIDQKNKKKTKIVSEQSKKLKTSMLLKSKIDICANSQGETILNDTGNPGMTVGGTGDVLSGIAGALLSKNIPPFKTAQASSFINGLAGDICQKEMGSQFTATDVKDKIPKSIEKAKKYW